MATKKSKDKFRASIKDKQRKHEADEKQRISKGRSELSKAIKNKKKKR